jgi:hypothetical protein
LCKMNVFVQIDALYHMQNDMQVKRSEKEAKTKQIKKAPAEAGDEIISQEDVVQLQASPPTLTELQ